MVPHKRTSSPVPGMTTMTESQDDARPSSWIPCSNFSVASPDRPQSMQIKMAPGHSLPHICENNGLKSHAGNTHSVYRRVPRLPDLQLIMPRATQDVPDSLHSRSSVGNRSLRNPICALQRYRYSQNALGLPKSRRIDLHPFSRPEDP